MLDDVQVAQGGLQKNRNAGRKILNKCDKLPGLNAEVWHDKTGVTNILSFVDIVDQYHMTYNNVQEAAFFIHEWVMKMTKF